MRTSRPYVEEFDGPPTVRAGERVERDDGWWRAVHIAVIDTDPPRGAYRSTIEWVPMPLETDLNRIEWLTDTEPFA